MEGGEGAGDFFVWEQAGEGEAGVIVDGDMEGFDAGAWVAMGLVARGAHAWALEAAQLLDVEVEEVAWVGVFAADDRRRRRIEGGQAVEAVALEDAG